MYPPNYNRSMIVQVQKDLKPLLNWHNSPLKTPQRSIFNLFTPPGFVPRHLCLKMSTTLISWAASYPMPPHPDARKNNDNIKRW